MTPIITKIFDENVNNIEIYNLVKEFPGVNQNTVNDWFNKYNREYIIERINILLKQLAKGKEIKNPMGYLQKLMLQETLFTGFEEKTSIKPEAKKTNRNLEKSMKDKIKELEELKVFYYETQNQIVNEFLLANNNEKNQVLEFIQLSPHYDVNQSLEDNLQRVTLVALINTKVRDSYPKLFVELDKKYFEHESAIKNNLKVLGYNG